MSERPARIPPQVAVDTLNAANELKECVEAGECVGAIIAFLYRGRRYSVSISGEAHRDPTWARGVMATIDDELRRLISDRARDDTTL